MSATTSVYSLPQRIKRNFPRLFRLLLGIVALNVTLFVLLRMIFWFMFYRPDYGAPDETLLQSLYIGMKFDLRLALIIVLPLFLLGWSKRLTPFQSRRHSRFWIGYFTTVQVFVILFYIGDFGYYAYLQARLDATSLRFLENPAISMQMIWESYPVIWITLAVLIISAAYTQILQRIFTGIAQLESRPLPTRHRAWIATAGFFIVLFGIYGKFSYYPLRWSDAYFTTNQFASMVALNPVLYFFDTLKNKNSSFDIDRTRGYYERMVKYLGVDRPDKTRLNFTRATTSAHHLPGRPNVVMVFLESFAAAKLGIHGNPLDASPHFDALARDGLFFRRFYTPHTGTARSVFAGVTGIPDIEVNQTSSRNPLVVKQQVVVNEFKGYDKYYFLGGSANWGNIRGVLSGNIPGLKMYEEGSFGEDSERIDVWGISDLDLFREANRVLRQQRDKPFFAIIQTASNHRPYTIPEDSMGFRYDRRKGIDWVKLGFDNEREYNAFRLLDHSIGKFIEMAWKEDYFDNTLFAFFGDHAVPEVGEHMPKYLQQMHLGQVRVPFVIYAPVLIPRGRQYDKIASELDVLPTLAGLALPRYTNTTLGRDLLDPDFDDQRYAFTVEHSLIPEVGLIDDKFYFRTFADGTRKRLFRLDDPQPARNVIGRYPEKARQLEELCLGIYETAQYMRFNNSPEHNGAPAFLQAKAQKAAISINMPAPDSR